MGVEMLGKSATARFQTTKMGLQFVSPDGKSGKKQQQRKRVCKFDMGFLKNETHAFEVS